MTEHPPSHADLRKATLAGIRWTTLARLGAEFLALASSVVLARLVPPAEFGRAAVAMVVVAVAGVVMSQGIGAPLVALKPAGAAAFASGRTLAVGSGLLGAVLVFVAGHTLVPPVLGDRIAELVRLTAVAFLVAPVGAVGQAILQRELRFRRLAFIEVVSLLIGVAASVALAVAGADAGALVGGALVSLGAAGVLAAALAPWGLPGWHPAEARRIAAFGLHSGLASLFYTVFRRVDYAILAARMTAADVGYYWRAYQLGVEYQSKVTTVMLKVSFPVFSRTASAEHMRRVRARIVRLHATVVIPPLAAFIAIAPVAVPWLYGSNWAPAVGPAQLLAVVGMGTAIVTGIGPLLMAAGKPRVLMLYNLVTLIVYIAAVYLAAPYGLTTVCLVVLGVQAVNFVATQYLLLQRLMGIPVRSLVAEVAPGIVSAAALLAVTYPLVDRLTAAGVAPVPTFTLALALALAITLTVLWRLFPTAWGDVTLIVRSVLRRQRASASASS